jgi:hypothetical protein
MYVALGVCFVEEGLTCNASKVHYIRSAAKEVGRDTDIAKAWLQAILSELAWLNTGGCEAPCHTYPFVRTGGPDT